MAVMVPRGGMSAQPDWFQQFQNQEQGLNQNPPIAPGAQSPQATPMTATNPSDPASFLQAYVAQHENDPDFDPSLKSDPAYWIRVINENGGLDSPSKQAYWADKFKTARGQQPGSGGAGTLGGLGRGSLLSSYGQQFQAPTEQDALNSPGLLFALGQGQQAIGRSAAARGTYFTPQMTKALERYTVGTALQGYGDVFNRSLSQYNTNYNVWDRQRNFENDTLNQTANRGAGVSQ